MEPIQLSLSSSQGDRHITWAQTGAAVGGEREAPTTHKDTNPVGCCTGALLQGCPCAQGSAFTPGALGVPSAPRGVVVLEQEALLRPLQETQCATGMLEKFQWDHMLYSTRVIRRTETLKSHQA